MKNIILSALTASVFLSFFNSCTPDPTPTPDHPHEEIDEVDVHFIKMIGGLVSTDTTSVTFNVAGTPSVSPLILKSSTTYKMIINPKMDGNSISSEIIEEGTEHRFFFFSLPPSGIVNYVYNDMDANNKGIGLDGDITFGTEDHEFNIKLRHGLDKSHASASSYNSPNYQEAGGEDDLNLKLPITLIP